VVVDASGEKGTTGRKIAEIVRRRLK
jgi:hypothetical protein